MIYTKNGDGGYTKNAKNYSYQKDNVLFELLGTIDELSANLGLVKAASSSIIGEIADAYQHELIKLSGYIAGGSEFDFASAVARTEQLIDTYSKRTVLPKEFIVSGKTLSGTYLDIARTVARRAERIAVKANKIFMIKKEDLPYFNRISDLFFVLARYEDQSAGADKGDYIPHGNVKADNAVNNENLNLKSADALINKVIEKAKETGVLAVCAVCDAGGNLIALKRDDDAFIASVKIAQDKAYTAVSLKMPTYKLENLTKPGESLYGIQHQDNRIVVFGGGVPLYQNGRIVGGFGVSGGTLEQDTFLGDYADKLYNTRF